MVGYPAFEIGLIFFDCSMSNLLPRAAPSSCAYVLQCLSECLVVFCLHTPVPATLVFLANVFPKLSSAPFITSSCLAALFFILVRRVCLPPIVYDVVYETEAVRGYIYNAILRLQVL